jgi:hypothetical protein
MFLVQCRALKISGDIQTRIEPPDALHALSVVFQGLDDAILIEKRRYSSIAPRCLNRTQQAAPYHFFYRMMKKQIIPFLGDFLQLCFCNEFAISE